MIDRKRIEDAVLSIIKAIGEDPSREGLRGTPRRVAQMYEELFCGLYQNPSEVLATGFEEGHHELVVLKDIAFFSVCEHHLLPFYGSAHIGYIPNGRVVGASKLARSLDILARRPQIQERLTNQLADTIYSTLDPVGVIVLLRAEHLCMSLRGVKKQGSQILTSASRGILHAQASARQEFLTLLSDT